ncbi:hypothetical protein D3C72_972840 [compost metagenome]
MPRCHQRIYERLVFSRDLHRLRLSVGIPLRFCARADYGRGDGAVVQHPGNGEFDDAHTALLGVLLDLLGNAQGFDAPFGFEDAFVLAPGAAVGLRFRVWCVLAAEHTTGQRTIWHDTEAVVLRGGDLLGFSLAVDDVV